MSTRKATFADIGTIETPDPLTVVFKMKAVNAAMLEHFASPWNVIYSAKDLGENPANPRTKINGTGPFTFVEHVKGSHVSGKKNDNYFKKGLPYLDGWKGIFTLQAAAMLNAVQGGQVLGEFRGISPAERDRLVAAMGDKIRIEEVELDAQSAGLLQHREEAVRRRARAQGAAAGDRPLGRQPGPVEDLDAALGRRRGPPRLAVRDAGSRSWSSSRASRKDIKKSREEASKLLKEAGQENLKFTLWNRNLAMPYTPAGIFLVDQWRQIGVTVEHKQSDTGAYLAHMNAGNHDVAIDFSNLFMDDTSLGLAKYLSLRRAPENRSRSKDEVLDKLFDDHMRERDVEKRKALIRQFEKRLFEQAYQQPLLWWHRIVATHKVADGLADVAEPQSRRPARRGLAEYVDNAHPATRRQRRVAPFERTMLRYTVNRVLLMIPTLIGVAVLVFFMLRVVPGDVVEIKLRGDGGSVSQETIEMERKRMGLDKPLVTQFGEWMVGMATARLRQVDVDRAAGDGGDRAAA